MTPQNALALLRSKLDELGISDGFYKDTDDLYPYITNGEREAAALLVANYLLLRRIGQGHAHSPSLSALIKQDASNTTTVGSGYQEYALPSDYLETYTAEYNYSGSGTSLKLCTLVTWDEARQRESTTMGKASAEKPIYYIKGTNIGFFPQPIGGAANMYDHWYLKNPREITSVITTFTLGVETHYAIVDYATGQALIKDGRADEGLIFIKKFTDAINKL